METTKGQWDLLGRWMCLLLCCADGFTGVLEHQTLSIGTLWVCALITWQFYFSEGIKNSQAAAVSCGSISREILVMNQYLKPPICFSFMCGELTMCQAPWKVLSARSKQGWFWLKRSQFEKRWLDSSPIGSSEAVTWFSPVILYWLRLPMLLRLPCFSEWLVVSGNHRYRDGRRCSP